MTTPAALLELSRGAFYDTMDQVIGDFDSHLSSTNIRFLNETLACLMMYCTYIMNRRNFYNHGLLRHLINLVMNTQTDASVARKALCILRLCSSDAPFSDVCRTPELMHRVFGFLDLKDIDLAEILVAFFFNLSARSSGLRQVIMDMGFLPAIIGIFTGRVEATLDLKGLFLSTIVNLGTDAAFKLQIADEYDMVKLLETELTACDTMDNPSPTYLGSVLRCIFCFTALDRLKLPFAECDIFPRLIRHLNSTNTRVVFNALGALANIANNRSAKHLFSNLNTHVIIVELSRSVGEDILAQLARLCMSLTVLRTDRIRLGKNKHVREAMMRLVHSENANVYLNACGTIGNLTIEDQFTSLFVSAGLVERLCHLLRDQDERIRLQILRCLFNCSVIDKGLKIIKEWPDIHTHLFKSLRSSNADIRFNAAGILANMAIGRRAKLDLFNANIMQVLVGCINSKDFDINKQFARLLFAISGTRVTTESLVNSKVIHKLVRCIQPESTILIIQQINMNIAGTIANVADYFKNEVLNSGAVPVMIKLACSTCDTTDARKQAIRCVNILLKNTGWVTAPGCVVDVVSEYNGNEQTEMQKRFATLYGRVLQANVDSEIIDKTGTITSASVKPTRDNKRDRVDDQIMVDRSMKTRSSFEHDLMLVLPIQVDGEVKYFRFHCHQLIVIARWKDLLRFSTIKDELKMVVVLPPDWALTRDAWMRFVLYLYSNNFLYDNEIKDKSVLISPLIDLARLAIKTNMHSVCYLLKNVYGIVKSWNDDELEKYYESNVRGKCITSSWGDDMHCLIDESYSGSKDIELIADINDCYDEDLSCETVYVKRLKTDTQSNNSRDQQVIIKAHQLILTTCSDYFKSMLDSPYWRNSRKNRLRIEGSAKAIRILLTYYYCGYTQEIDLSITSDLSLLFEVLALANKYNCETLVAICEKKMLLSPNFNESCFYDMLQQPVITRTPVIFLACVYNFYEAVKNQKMSVQDNLLRLKDLAGIKSGEIEAYDSFEIEIASEIESIIKNWSN